MENLSEKEPSQDMSKYLRFLSKLSVMVKDYDETAQMLEQADYFATKMEILGKYKEKQEAISAVEHYSKDLEIITKLVEDNFNMNMIQARNTVAELIGALRIHEDTIQEYTKSLHGLYILDKANLVVEAPEEVEVDDVTGESLTFLRSDMDTLLARGKARIQASFDRLNLLTTKKILIVS